MNNRNDRGSVIEREVPRSIEAKHRAWRMWCGINEAAHYSVGFTSVLFSGIVAAHTKHPFLSENWAVALASISTALSFLMTTLGSQKRAAAFEAAHRILERAIAIYQLAREDPGPEFLAEAEVKGIDALDNMR